ncbi:MAG: hypothetical protein WCF47_01370 [Pseudolabrys sp.]
MRAVRPAGRATKQVDLIVNSTTAKVLGLKIEAFLLRENEVIE